MTHNDYARLGRRFIRLGWISFWLQLIIAIIPLCLFAFLLLGRASGNRGVLDLTDILALVALSILVFTTMWSLRYVRLGKRLCGESRPTVSALMRALWIGMWASCAGIVASLVLLLIEVVRLLILFLMAPQGGVPVFQTQPDDRTYWVSAMDVVSLLAELCTLSGELIVLGITLWLLFKVSWLAREEDSAERSATQTVDASATEGI